MRLPAPFYRGKPQYSRREPSAHGRHEPLLLLPSRESLPESVELLPEPARSSIPDSIPCRQSPLSRAPG